MYMCTVCMEVCACAYMYSGVRVSVHVCTHVYVYSIHGCGVHECVSVSASVFTCMSCTCGCK